MPPEQVFKTLLVTGGPNIYRFAVVPGDAELDFKKLARAAGLRKAEMAPLKDVQPLTGYIRGGVTLFGARKPYPVYIDETAILFDKISVSAGTRGTQLILSPEDYLKAAHALDVEVQTADMTKATAETATESHPKIGEPGAILATASSFMGGKPKPIPRRLWTHLAKDLRIEWRSKDAINSMLFFAFWSWCSSPCPSIPAAPLLRRLRAAFSAWPPCLRRSAH